MKYLIGFCACLLVGASLCAAVFAQSNSRTTTPEQSAAIAQSPPLEVGKSYTFSWTQGSVHGSVVEVPRGGWVKIKEKVTENVQRVHWVNLGLVIFIAELPTQM
jgi:hypothetical protein